MTVRPGHPWGRPAGEITTIVDAGSDAAVAAQLAAGVTGPFGLTAGDLHRSVGAPEPSRYTTIVPVDALAVRLDDRPEQLAVAHVVARRGWWRGPIVAVCNVEFLGSWNVAPRAHPNDGRADVVEVAAPMPRRARWQAWRRLPQGTHVPHPAITTRSVRSATFDFARPLSVSLDGVPVGAARRLVVVVRPDAFELYV